MFTLEDQGGKILPISDQIYYRFIDLFRPMDWRRPSEFDKDKPKDVYKLNKSQCALIQDVTLAVPLEQAVGLLFGRPGIYLLVLTLPSQPLLVGRVKVKSGDFTTSDYFFLPQNFMIVYRKLSWSEEEGT